MTAQNSKHTSKPTVLARLSRLSPVALFRSLAGMPAGVQPTRRGTVLVLILGALALISIVTLVYATIGQGDRRQSAIVQVKDSAVRGVEEIADYLARVVGDDVLDVFVDGDRNNQPVLVREATDYPFTDYFRKSINQNGGSDPHSGLPTQNRRFSATGGYRDRMVSSSDPRMPADPWLAVLEPARIFDTANLPTAAPQPGEQRDWIQISNFAPDGRFVNLFNLRNNFDSKPGYNSTGGQPGDISAGLSLLDASGNPTQQLAVPGFFGLNGSANANPNIPAHWTMYQRGAYRPIRDTLRGVSDRDWTGYQWADADGDGFADSRWFELVDAWEAAHLRHILPHNENFRWFIAARCVDLSGLVNVNTALDSVMPAMSTTGAPQPLLPQGLAPEVDLRRILTMTDIFQQYGSSEGYQTLGPDLNGYDETQSRTIGIAGYAVLQNVLGPGLTEAPPSGTNYPPVTMSGDERFVLFTDYARAMNYGTLDTGGGSGVRGRRTSGQFGTADLLELFTFFGVNDPRTTSYLEQVLGGRGVANRSPLRDDRGLALERPLDLQLEIQAYNTNVNPPAGSPEYFTFNRVAYDIRHMFTTISGARPIRSDVVTNPNRLTAAELTVDPRPMLESIGSGGSAAPLFKAYAKALMPYAGVLNGWVDRSSTQRHPNQTLYFGFDPEIALRTAAHLTANLIDCFDHDGNTTNAGTDRRTAFRVRLMHNANVGTSPYPVLDLDDDLDPSAPPEDRKLASASNELYAVSGSEYIDVFGIEAQPFVVQVTSFCLYTDASAPDGDTEDEEITINGTPSLMRASSTSYPIDNSDYLGQILAFQLVNPFDRAIDLTNYYIEYGEGQFLFKPTGTLAAGESKVYYVQSCVDMEERWRTVEPTLPTGVVDAWAKKQFAIVDPNGASIDPVRIDLRDTTDITVTYSQPVDFFASPNTNKYKMGTVHLWYNMTPDSDPDLWRDNDILVDRLRDTGLETRTTPLLDVRLPSVNNDIAGTDVAAEPDPEGWTIALTATIKRSDDPALMSGTIPLGGIPAYCIEPHDEDILAPTNGGWNSSAANATYQKPGYLITPTASDFNSPYGGTDPNDVLLPASVPVLESTLTQHPDQKNVDWIAENLDKITFLGAPTDPAAPPRHPPLRPEIMLKNDKFQETIQVGSINRTVSTLRVTDMLLPLGIGPMSAPVPPPADPAQDPYAGWLTLGEALAMATNYTSFGQAVIQPTDPRYVFRPYANIGKFGTGALDRGNLVLDDFAPFEDVDMDGLYGPGDKRRGPGIPLALNILNTFGTLSGADALTSPIPGRVNINTTPLAVFRALGLLTPTPEDSGSVWQNWIQEAGIGAGRTATVPQDAPTGGNASSDIGAALLAYRDQITAFDLTGRPINYIYRGYTPSAGGGGTIPTYGTDMASGIASLRGRLYDETTGALSEGASGFGSPGEIMCAIRREQPRLPLQATSTDAPNGIDFLAYDETGGQPADSGTKGMLTARYEDGATNPPAKKPDEMPNNYAERLLLASGVMNSISVRSDVFAVWFVAHGYTRQDCEDLAPTDPLVPSVAKRYLMVIDRSNVLRKGDKPKILLFTEVPM